MISLAKTESSGAALGPLDVELMIVTSAVGYMQSRSLHSVLDKTEDDKRGRRCGGVSLDILVSK